MKKVLFLALLAQASTLLSQKIAIIGTLNKDEDPPFSVSGSVYSIETGNKIEGANIVIEKHNLGTNTDEDGDYSFELYQGTYYFNVSMVGYESIVKPVSVVGSGFVNFSLKESVVMLNEVVFEARSEDHNVSSNEIGTEVLNIASIKTLPLIGGEVNVLNSLTLLPGVSTQGEASSGFNVRGGGIDQNLILLGGATLYNPFHLFGFYSGFNASMVRDVSLHKGAIPAQYGGRASSVVDVAYKKGNFKQWEGDLTLGTSASKFSVRGPIVVPKLAFMGGGRIAYPNWMIRRTRDPNIANSTAAFYDANIVLNYIVNEKNDIEYSSYMSADSFQFPDNIENQWRNIAHVLKWNSQIKDDLLFDVSLVRSRYISNLIETAPRQGFDLERSINHDEINVNFDFLPSEGNELKLGGQVKLLENNLGTMTPKDESSVLPTTIDPENAIESAIYFQHDYSITDKIGIAYGLRYSIFSNRGPGSITQYETERTRSTNSALSTSEFGKESIQNYTGLEPRIAVNVQLNNLTSLKLGYGRHYQYIHLLTNTTSVSPVDSWKLSDPFILPQTSTQYSIGLFRNFANNKIESSIQGFYKNLKDIPAYKDGADLLLNSTLETELTTAQGRAFGLEFLLDKSRGRTFGWLSYTFSRSLRTIDNGFEEEVINGGSEFPSNFDRPHSLNIVFNHRISGNATFSTVFNYSSGSPFTLPQGKFQYNGLELGFFNRRNNFRAPPTHRLDVSLQFELPAKHKVGRGQWTLSVYNLYGRNNPFSVFFQDLPGRPPGGYKLSIVGSPLPSISYELKF